MRGLQDHSRNALATCAKIACQAPGEGTLQTLTELEVENPVASAVKYKNFQNDLLRIVVTSLELTSDDVWRMYRDGSLKSLLRIEMEQILDSTNLTSNPSEASM